MTNPIEGILENHSDCKVCTATPDDDFVLVKLHALLREEHKFNVGGVVEWKPGLSNKTTPYKKPLIVTKVLKEPVITTEESSGGPYFMEKLDIVCAELCDGVFYEFYYDSRRLQPWQSKQGDTPDV